MSWETFIDVMVFFVAGFLLGHSFGYYRTPPERNHNIKAQTNKGY